MVAMHPSGDDSKLLSPPLCQQELRKPSADCPAWRIMRGERLIMRLTMIPLVVAATLVGAQPQYRTHNDRMVAPRFTSAEAWASRAHYLREHVLASAGLLPMPEKTPL